MLVTTLLSPQVEAVELHNAVLSNDMQAVVNLLRDDAGRELFLSKFLETGQTALHIAVLSFRKHPTQQALEMIKLLLHPETILRSQGKVGPSLSQELFLREAGRKTLAFAAANILLLQRHVNTLLLERDAHGDTALFYAVNSFSYIFNSDNDYALGKELIKILLNDNAAQGRCERLSQTNKRGENALEQAICCDDVKIAELLLPHYEMLDLLAQKDVCGRTALFKAIERGSVNIVHLLLPRYEKLGLLAQKDMYGGTVLHAAMRSWNRKRLVGVLLPYCKRLDLLKAEDKYGRTILDEAILRNNEGMVALLLPYFSMRKNNQIKRVFGFFCSTCVVVLYVTVLKVKKS